MNAGSEIDPLRLNDMYTVDGKPLKNLSGILSIDKFKLHDGHKYAAHITAPETGRIITSAIK